MLIVTEVLRLKMWWWIPTDPCDTNEFAMNFWQTLGVKEILRVCVPQIRGGLVGYRHLVTR